LNEVLDFTKLACQNITLADCKDVLEFNLERNQIKERCDNTRFVIKSKKIDISYCVRVHHNYQSKYALILWISLKSEASLKYLYNILKFNTAKKENCLYFIWIWNNAKVGFQFRSDLHHVLILYLICIYYVFNIIDITYQNENQISENTFIEYSFITNNYYGICYQSDFNKVNYLALTSCCQRAYLHCESKSNDLIGCNDFAVMESEVQYRCPFSICPVGSKMDTHIITNVKGHVTIVSVSFKIIYKLNFMSKMNSWMELLVAFWFCKKSDLNTSFSRGANYIRSAPVAEHIKINCIATCLF